MLEVIYADTKLDVPADTDMKALEAAMIENFPELKNPTITAKETLLLSLQKLELKAMLFRLSVSLLLV